ncbi:hypothetical protein Ancab_001562 [Ancistrocladus abbreviatus]
MGSSLTACFCCNLSHCNLHKDDTLNGNEKEWELLRTEKNGVKDMAPSRQDAVRRKNEVLAEIDSNCGPKVPDRPVISSRPIGEGSSDSLNIVISSLKRKKKTGRPKAFKHAGLGLNRLLKKTRGKTSSRHRKFP